MKPRVYITRLLPGEPLKGLTDLLDVKFWPKEDEAVPRRVLLDAVRGVDGLLSMLTDPIDEQLLEAAPDLKIVANMAAGYDNIDISACTSRGVMVTNTPEVSSEAVADLALGLLLATARRIPEAQNELLRGRWKTWSPTFMEGRAVHNRTIGILGLGRIGSALARRAAGLSMKILYWDKYRNEEAEKSLGARFTGFEHLLKEADFVVVLLPLTEDTRGLIGENELSLMKPTSVLINVGRGPIVDSRALYQALAHGTIWGAGLDVYDVEPVDPHDPLVNLKNVVALPHIGSATAEARQAMARRAVSNLIAGVTGDVPRDLINREVLDKRGTRDIRPHTGGWRTIPHIPSESAQHNRHRVH